jgi:hypothetical protein
VAGRSRFSSSTDDLDPLRPEFLQIGLELEEVAAAGHVGALGVGEGIGEGAVVVAPADVVEVVGEHAVDRVAHHVDDAGVADH